MRFKIQAQSKLVEAPPRRHQHVQELERIDRLLREHPEMAELAHADLVRGTSEEHRGRPGMLSAEQVLRILLIKQMNGFSYEMLRFHLRDSKSYGAFCGFGIGDEVPSGTTLCRDIKKIREETLEQLNRIVLGIASSEGIEKGGKVRVDATVVESNIHPPTDSSLLDDGVRVLCRIAMVAKDIFGVSASDHRRRAKRRALEILNARTEQARKSAYGDLLKVSLMTVAQAEKVRCEVKRLAGKDLLVSRMVEEELGRMIPLVSRAISQTQRRIWGEEKVPASEKIVSLFEPHTNVIVKNRRETVYGHKITLSSGASGLFTDLVIEDGNPADSTLAKGMIERHKEIYGRVPRQAAFDGGYACKDNLAALKTLGLSDVVFHKKCGLKVPDMAKSTWVYKRLRNFRAGIEGMISFLKRCFGLTRCTWHGLESFKAYAWSSVLSANLLLLSRRLSD